MDGKDKYISLFNKMIRGEQLSFKEELLPVVSEYLTENNVENSQIMINSLIQNPQLVKNVMPEIVDYYCRKYNILSIQQSAINNSINFFKTILYYD